MTQKQKGMPGTKNFSRLIFFQDAHGNRTVDFDATLKEVNKTKEEIMNNVWERDSVENRLKIAAIHKERKKKK